MKMNKAVAGYHMLMILSELDGEFDGNEGLVVIRYLKDNFPFHINMDNEVEILSTLDREKYPEHFRRAAEDFFSDSTEHERSDFLKFAISLVKADAQITRDENQYIDMLCDSWDIN
jgi:hypothetical protein